MPRRSGMAVKLSNESAEVPMETRKASTSANERHSEDRQFVEALSRGLSVLRCFKVGDSSLGNQEIARRSKLPKATVARLTYTLCKLGYLRLTSEGQYALGIPVLGLGYACLTGMKIRDIAQPYMQELAEHAGPGVLVALGGLDTSSIVYIACARSSGMLSLLLNVGSHVSAVRSGIGRAYMAGLTDKERAVLLPRLLMRYSESEQAQHEQRLVQAQAQVKEYGFCLNLGEWQPDVNTVAVPFRTGNPDDPPLAFNCGGASYLLPKERLVGDLGPRLVEMARKIQFAYRGARTDV